MKKPLFGLFCIVLFGVHPQVLGQSSSSDQGLVEIHYPIDIYKTYKERRRTHGWNLGFNWQQYAPLTWESQSYASDETSAVYYEDVYDSTPVDLFTFEGGYKLNFALGSLNFLAGISFGSLSVESYGFQHNITVNKYFAKGMFVLDNIMPEPYIAPYVSGSVWQMRIAEDITDTDFGGELTTGMGFDYSIGALIQLNWLEPDLALRSLNELGLENTYLDVFVTQHMDSQNSSDPSTATDFSYGAGLRLEF